MQSMEYKRFPYQMVGLLVAAAAATVVILTATGTIFDSDDDTVESPRTNVPTNPANRPVSREEAMFLEWNTNLPGTNVGGDPLEMTSAPPVTSDSKIGTDRGTQSITAPNVIPYERMTFLEANQLPGDYTLPYFPEPSQPGATMTDY